MAILTLSEAKRHLNIELTDTDNDVYIRSLVDAAHTRIEQITKRKLLTQTVTEYFDDWPDGEYFELPYGKLQSVASVKYKDSDGDESTFSSDDYIVETNTEKGRVVLAYGESWPTVTLYPSKPIYIEYVCGYGANSSDVPVDFIHAIKMQISDMYEVRETNIVGVGVTINRLDTVKHLLLPYILY